MTSLFLVSDERVLLLFRRGSRAVPDSWVGIGGHVESSETGDLVASLLREVREEIGLDAAHIGDLALRYVGSRATSGEIRHTYYFTGTVHPTAPVPTTCAEGDLRWFRLDDAAELAALDMPLTARAVLDHWLVMGRYDTAVRSVLVGPDGGVTTTDLTER